MIGTIIGIIGLGLTVLLCGIGSGLGLKMTGKASAGVLAEDSGKFGKVIILTLLPATQGLYGFAIALIGASYLPSVANLTAAGISLANLTAEQSATLGAQLTAQGWYVFLACVPMMLGGAISAYLQGKTAAITIVAVGKNSDVSKAFLFPAMIEFYALLGLVVSIILFGQIPVADISSIVVPVQEAVEQAAGSAHLLLGLAA